MPTDYATLYTAAGTTATINPHNFTTYGTTLNGVDVCAPEDQPVTQAQFEYFKEKLIKTITEHIKLDISEEELMELMRE